MKQMCMILFCTCKRFSWRWIVSAFVCVFIGISRPTAVAQDLDHCEISSAMAFEEWKEWRMIFPEPYRSNEHRDWVNIYVDGLTAASATDEQFEECAKIAKVHFTNSSGIESYLLMLMVKMPSGFDPDHSDWWYGMYDTTVSTSVIEQGVIANCIKCHKRASNTDYVFMSSAINASME
jgi:hypothetical protein